ncbi:MAG: hypothetical protein QMD82_00095 [bacterium]|nr:hypothetical protein [bacterium]
MAGFDSFYRTYGFIYVLGDIKWEGYFSLQIINWILSKKLQIEFYSLRKGMSLLKEARLR